MMLKNRIGTSVITNSDTIQKQTLRLKHSVQKEREMERNVREMAFDIYTELWLEKKLCDVLITADGAEFHAHKIILCGYSMYFKALFTSACNPPDKYSIPDVSSEIMQLIMEYMYMQHVTIREENVRELLIAANYLSVSSLVNECCLFLKAQLCLKNCIGIWRFADFYFCENLKQQAFQFILYNFEQMVHVSEEFLDLTVKELSEIIEHDQLNVKKENVVFQAILQWIEHVLQERKAHIAALLPKVRLGLLSHDYIMNDIRNNALVSDTMACKPTIRRVLMGDSLPSDLTRPRLPSTVLLSIGGWGSRGFTNDVLAYDMRAKCWVNLPCNDKSPRASHGTVYLNGFVYCIGGRDRVNYLSSVRRFDPIAKTWAEVGPMHSRRGLVSVCVLDSRIYAMGGFDSMEQLNTAERYEPENNQWSMIAPMHIKRTQASATALNGKVYICGGFDGNVYLCTAECYSPQTDQWTLIPNMTRRRSGLGVIAYGGEVYAVGGFDGNNLLKNVEVYDPQTKSWRDAADMITGHHCYGIEVMDDLLVVIGGYKCSNSTCTVECYDKETDEWHEIEEAMDLHINFSCCVLPCLPNMVTYTALRDLRIPQS